MMEPKDMSRSGLERQVTVLRTLMARTVAGVATLQGLCVKAGIAQKPDIAQTLEQVADMTKGITPEIIDRMTGSDSDLQKQLTEMTDNCTEAVAAIERLNTKLDKAYGDMEKLSKANADLVVAYDKTSADLDAAMAKLNEQGPDAAPAGDPEPAEAQPEDPAASAATDGDDGTVPPAEEPPAKPNTGKGKGGKGKRGK